MAASHGVLPASGGIPHGLRARSLLGDEVHSLQPTELGDLGDQLPIEGQTVDAAVERLEFYSGVGPVLASSEQASVGGLGAVMVLDGAGPAPRVGHELAQRLEGLGVHLEQAKPCQAE